MNPVWTEHFLQIFKFTVDSTHTVQNLAQRFRLQYFSLLPFDRTLLRRWNNQKGAAHSQVTRDELFLCLNLRLVVSMGYPQTFQRLGPWGSEWVRHLHLMVFIDPRHYVVRRLPPEWWRHRLLGETPSWVKFVQSALGVLPRVRRVSSWWLDRIDHFLRAAPRWFLWWVFTTKIPKLLTCLGTGVLFGSGSLLRLFVFTSGGG